MKQTGHQKTPFIPAEYAGKWIAWDKNHEHIVASGESLQEVRDNVSEKVEDEVWYTKAPAQDEFFGGAAFHA